jgi:hypothetical protein
MANTCKHGNGLSVWITFGEFLDCLKDYQLLKKDIVYCKVYSVYSRV